MRDEMCDRRDTVSGFNPVGALGETNLGDPVTPGKAPFVSETTGTASNAPHPNSLWKRCRLSVTGVTRYPVLSLMRARAAGIWGTPSHLSHRYPPGPHTHTRGRRKNNFRNFF